MSSEKWFVATCRAGLEPVLASEIESLGLKIRMRGLRMVSFFGDHCDMYRANLCLRTALNILTPIRTFNARTYDLLYFQSRKVPWHKLFSVDCSIKIDVKGSSPSLNHSQFVTHRIKDSITDTFRKLVDGKRPDIQKRDPDIHIVAYLYRDEVTLYLDSSGEPLFKRGYRRLHSEAPLKEDLAAGILMLAGWQGGSDFIDPMCGTGTFLFEAFMMDARMAPNLNRKFSFMKWLDFDEPAFNRVRDEVKSKERPSSVRYFGFEADHHTVTQMNKIADEYFPFGEFSTYNQNFQDTPQTFDSCFLVTNPPYGHRLSHDDLPGLYRDLGRFLRGKCPGSKAAILTAFSEGVPHLGLKADKKKKLYNGSLECRLYTYRIF